MNRPSFKPKRIRETTGKSPDFEGLPHSHPCSACGTPLDADDPFCPACGQPQQVALPQSNESYAPAKHFSCKNCGAELTISAEHRSDTCPFCDSPYVVELQGITKRQPPEFVIGFQVTPEQAQATFRNWFRQNNWTRPSDLHTATIEQKLQGIYLPFWTFSLLAQSQWHCSIGEYYYRTKTYRTYEKGKWVTKTKRVRETEWYPLAGKFNDYTRGYLVCGSNGLPQVEVDRIKPFHTETIRRYDPKYLAGWSCEEYTVEREAALQYFLEHTKQDQQRKIQQYLPGDTNKQLRVMTEFDHIQSDLVLLPVYLLTYRYEDRLYRFLLNGQTGRYYGSKPIAWRRIMGVIGIGVVVVVIIGAMLAFATMR
ncbi:Double zinc ribbon [Planctomycetales bacterium 10988]|nr:Double zinc ribbon [Planctomycetales bacterium 10988]